MSLPTFEEIRDGASTRGLEEAAAAGDQEAVYRMGVCLQRGWGVSENPEKAAQLYAQAAAQGHAEAIYALGVCYFMGVGLDQDLAKGADLFKQAAEEGVPNGIHAYGRCLLKGEGVPENEPLAMRHFREAAELGHAGASYIMARENDDNDEERLRFMRQAAEGGDAEAQCMMGMFYRHGECDLEVDYDQACHWFERSAAQDDLDAKYYLSLHLITGRGIAQDLNRGYRLCEEAAEAGHAVSQFAFGSMLESGNDDPQSAMRWYMLAANQGDADAQFTAGRHYLEGNGVIENVEEARRLLALSAKQGHAEATELLATLSAAPARSEDAVAEFQERAIGNDGDAQLQLGLAYHLGQGAAKDPRLAYFWLTRAMLAGCYDATQHLQPCMTQLPMEEFGTMQTAIYSWSPGMPVPALGAAAGSTT